MTHTINIYYFPRPMRITAILLILVGGFVLYKGYSIWAVLIAAVCAFMLTAQYVTVIDAERKIFIDTFSFFGMRVGGDRKHFNTLNRIIITKGNYNQKISTRSSDRQLNWSDYTGTLIYDGTGSLDLLTRERKKELVDALKVYATALHVDIEDHSISSSSRYQA